MYPFHNQISSVPYLFLAAAAVGINVIRTSHVTGQKKPLSQAVISGENMTNRDKYEIPQEEQERFNSLKAFVEESTKFVYLNKIFAARVSVLAKDGDLIYIAGHHYRVTDGVLEDANYSGNGVVFPALEVFDVEIQGRLDVAI